jgi:exopolyphosphatase / guanosine-5'-triphosphate,3'-diphosphate pyrophosphatase
MERALGALHVCADKLRRRNVHLARSVATEACRRAKNGEEFIERVREETGIVLDIISAQEEARLAVLGCHILLEDGDRAGDDLRHRRRLDRAGADRARRPGAAHPRLAERALGRRLADRDRRATRRTTAPTRLGAMPKMRRMVSDSFAQFAERIAPRRGRPTLRLLGTSGTVTTLASLHLELPQYDRARSTG